MLQIAGLHYHTADIIGVESVGNLDYFAKDACLRDYRCEVLYSWAEEQQPMSVQTDYRLRLGLAGKVVFFYGGNIGLAQDMDNLIRLADSLRHYENIHFILVGEGSEVSRLKEEIYARGLRNIAILPSVSQENYLNMISEFDVGVISLDRRLTSHNIPGKLFGYMNCRIPVLASLNPGNDLATILNTSGAGIACNNGDDKCLQSAALKLANNRQLRLCMGSKSRELLKSRFSVAAAANQILSHCRHGQPV